MNAVVQQLVDLLKVQPIEKNVFVGLSQDLGFNSLFGGQVLGQSLAAVCQTVEANRPIHSLHGYFIRSGSSSDPIYYEVDLIRSGRSFSTRRVVAKQNGLAIFSMSASFHAPEEGFEHSVEMPKVPGPDGIMSELDMARHLKAKIPESKRDIYTRDRAIELRIIDPADPFRPKPREAVKQTWMKTIDRLPDDPLVHRALLAYASDFGLSTTALLPHGVSFLQPDIQITSLDHALHFHRDFRMDEWLLYVKESPTGSGSRGLIRGQIFTQGGSLVASVTQEVLMRKIKKP